jgi:hypothetical protein
MNIGINLRLCHRQVEGSKEYVWFK